MENNETKKRCCICGGEYEGMGHNPAPVKSEGRCCGACNTEAVLPERVRRIRQVHETKKERVYISGAIEHYDPVERRNAFANAEKFLSIQGYEPINPFKNGLPADAHWREHMRADIRLLVDCDMIYMLRGWELSKGAKLELDVASSCGIQVIFQ